MGARPVAASAGAEVLVNWRRSNVPPFNVGSAAMRARRCWVVNLFLRCCGPVPDVFVDPLDEIFHVRRVGVATVDPAPREMSIQQAIIHGRHLSP